MGPFLWDYGIATFTQVLYLLEQKPTSNRCRSRLEAGSIPGSQVNKCQVSNKCWVPAVGMAVQRMLNIMKGCGQSSTRSRKKQVLACCSHQLPAFQCFWAVGWLKQPVVRFVCSFSSNSGCWYWQLFYRQRIRIKAGVVLTLDLQSQERK